MLVAGGFYGNALTGMAIGGALYAGGLALDIHAMRETGRIVVEALAIAGVITTVTKSLTGRSRPFTEDGPWMFRAVQIDNLHLSFPSGHATVAWAVSAVLAVRIDTPIASGVLYGLALATAFQRMDRDQHWASDVLLGSAIGFSVGKAVVRMHDARVASAQASLEWDVAPLLGGERNGLALSVRF